jgi:hypothetical protein
MESIFTAKASRRLLLFPSRAVPGWTMLAILLIVLFHAERDHFPASASPAVGSLRMQLFIAKGAGKHCGILLVAMILPNAGVSV